MAQDKARGRGFNIYLKPSTVENATREAKDRYGKSLSALIEALLVREISLKKGLLKSEAAK